MMKSTMGTPSNLEQSNPIQISPASRRYLIAPGVNTKIQVTLANQDTLENRIALSIHGAPEDWICVAPSSIRLAPNEQEVVELTIHPSRRAQPGPKAFSLVIRAISQDGYSVEEQIEILVGVSLVQGSIGLLTGTSQLEVKPGESIEVPIYLVNRGNAPANFKLAIDGLITSWRTLSSPELTLGSGEKRKITLTIQIPRNYEARAGRSRFVLRVSYGDQPDTQAELGFTLIVAVFTHFNCVIDPVKILAGQPVTIKLVNESNIPQVYSIACYDSGSDLVFLPKESILLPALPGEAVSAEFIIKPARRRWFDRQVELPFQILVNSLEKESKLLSGSVVSRGRIPFITFSDQLIELPRRIGHWYRHVNWPLVLGSLIVGWMLLVAIIGPRLALQNPMQENYTFAVNGQIVRPPYPPFRIVGYPLGTDQYGRDLLSRILWGVRPTMILVVTVAVVRLILGNLIGLSTGWSNGLVGRILGGVLSLALSIPVLIVALMGITAVGIRQGLWAFIVGLALTGWAESARLIATRTRMIKDQEYVEAAKALGSSDFRLLTNHVLRQIAPMLGMLLAFETSATLFVVAELGFLGYYIGGGIWVEVSDFVAVNVAGLPELGQMLSTALISLVNPSILVVVGSVVFFTILGFNLLGEGLRLKLSQPVAIHRNNWWLFGEKYQSKFGNRYNRSLTDWLESHTVAVGFSVAIFLLAGGLIVWQRAQPRQAAQIDQQGLVVPGGHQWASERHDAQGTRWAPVSGPGSSSVAWKYQAQGNLSGGPVVTADGSVILASLAKNLVALDPSGNELWHATLPDNPVGTPALGPMGEIYVAVQTGGLAAYDGEGKLMWYFVREGSREATSGPIVAPDGSIFYTQVDRIQAVKPDGQQAWNAYASDVYVSSPPTLSAGGSYLFLLDTALAAKNGVRLAMEGLPIQELKFTSPVLFVGADTKTYLRTGHEVIGWKLTDSGVKPDQPITWDYRNMGAYTMPPIDQGVTPGGMVWMFYGGDYNDSRLVWIDASGKLVGNSRLPDRQSAVIAIDERSTAYICSNNYGQSVNCQAIGLGKADPAWVVNLGDGIQVTGGALVPGRLYVATDKGMLVAIGAEKQ